MSKKTMSIFSIPVASAALPYMLCSSTMLVVNKLAVSQFPMPTVIIGLQLAFCVILLGFLHISGLRRMRSAHMHALGSLWIYCAAFALGMYSNMVILQKSSASLLLMARGFLPMLVCFVEWACMKRALPSWRYEILLYIVVGIFVSLAGSERILPQVFLVFYRYRFKFMGLRRP